MKKLFLFVFFTLSALAQTQVDWITQLKNIPSYDARKYNFAARTPGGTLASGNNSITLTTPIPGVNGSDTQHYLYVSGGTGSAEACLIAGGTATSTSAGTLIINCGGSHSGAWKLTSASGGIKEAAVVGNNIGKILIPGVATQLYAKLILPTTVSLIGQGYSGTSLTTGSILVCAVAANPCLGIADGLGTATGQGMGIHADYQLYGSGSGVGVWVGGDSAGVWSTASWTGSYLHFYNITVKNFTNALTHNRGNFVVYTNCVFSGSTLGVYFPSTGGGEHQPVDFYGTLISVSTGYAFQMEDNGFSSTPVVFYGGQISGTVGGNQLYLETYGTHYEPNEDNAAVLNLVGTGGIFKAVGGIMSVHGASVGSMINVNGTGFYQVTLKDIQVQNNVGTTTTNLVLFSTTLGGKLRVENIDIAAAGTFTNFVNISKATLDQAVTFYIIEPIPNINMVITAGATVTFPPIVNYPRVQNVQVFGDTIGGGITAIAGLRPYSEGILFTTAAQTFTAGASIGNTLTTTPNLPYTWWFDGTKFWIK